MLIWQPGMTLRSAKAMVVRAAMLNHECNRLKVAGELGISIRALRNMVHREPELEEFRHIRGRCQSNLCASCRRLDKP